jgi:hypothetical protein
MTATANRTPHVCAAPQVTTAIAPDGATTNHTTTHHTAAAANSATPPDAYRL